MHSSQTDNYTCAQRHLNESAISVLFARPFAKCKQQFNLITYRYHFSIFAARLNMSAHQIKYVVLTIAAVLIANAHIVVARSASIPSEMLRNMDSDPAFDKMVCITIGLFCFF